MKQLKQYFILELKKTFSAFPKLLSGSLLLLVLTFLCVFFIRSSTPGTVKNPPIFVGILAEKDEPFIDWIINTANSMPDMGYSVQAKKIDKKTAETDFFSEESNVLFIVPKNYISSIIHGENKRLTIRFSKSQTTVVNTLMKELADAASSFILDTEGAIYSMHDYYQKYHLTNESQDDLSLNIIYLEEIVNFSKALDFQKVNNGQDTSLLADCLSAGIVLLPLLLCLMFLPLMMSEGISLKQNLARIGIHIWKQVLVKETVFFLTILTGFLAIGILFLLVQIIYPAPIHALLTEQPVSGRILSGPFGILAFLLWCSPVFLFAAAFSFFLCEAAGEASGGMMLLFFSTIFMALFSGLFYPLRYLPEALKNAAVFLPLKHAGDYVLGVIWGQWNRNAFFILIVYSICFFMFTILILRFRQKGR